MVDNGENILVEFDYQNISVIDPNKIIDENGNPKERLIKQENLVFYANLECSVLPRTKLALGVPLNESIRTISVGNINFLNPGQKKFLDNSYTDEITGKNTLTGQGVNQPKIDLVTNPNKTDDFFYSQSLVSDGKTGAVDNGLLGITQINISYGTDFLPVIDITLEDIKGRALFEGGNNSPYAAFFQLPYPLFYLTIKGYLGKAVRLPLMLQSFTSSFDPSSGNFRVQLRMYTYKYTIMSHINWAGMMGAPLMYQSSVKTKTTQTTGQSNQNTPVKQSWSSIGYAKMKELYREYKSKGLIDDNFPEITIEELKIRLNKFLTNIIESYSKTNLNVLNDLSEYAETLTQYEGNVYLFASQETWSKKYLDYENIIVTKSTKENPNGITLYTFKKEYESSQSQSTALTELSGLVKRFNSSLLNNPTLGNGKSNSIPVNITMDINKKTGTFYSTAKIEDIDPNKTYFQINNTELPLVEKDNYLNKLKVQFQNNTYFYFEGKGSFLDQTTTIAENFQTKKQKIEDDITKDLSNKVRASVDQGGIGFEPTIRNVLAVFFASGESFLRMLDDVHTKAWDLRDDNLRKTAILKNTSTVASVDLKDKSIEETPIYPWPQLIVENNLKNDGEKYELKYPGDPSIATKIRAFSPEIWPEVQFVEEFIKATVERTKPADYPTDTTNSEKKPNRLSFNAIEFPINNQVFQNTEEVKFLYEIYERLLLNAFYSKLSRNSGREKFYNMPQYYSESEALDMINALGNDNPYLTKKLKNYNLTSSVYLAFLRHISNEGSGESWQNYIRGIFNTPYIKNQTNNGFEIINSDIIVNEISTPLTSIEDSTNVIEYFGNNNNVENFDFTDLYPLTNTDWDKTYLANGEGLQTAETTFKTSDVLNYNTTNKIITNYYTNSGKEKSPITNFNYNEGSNVFSQTLDILNLKTFYNNRKYEEQYITEGNLIYSDYVNNLTNTQTSSIMNSPYFINAIQEGVYNFRYNPNEQYPYKSAAFLFLNSLPLSTLKEKYREYNGDGTSNELSYIISTFKKFGAVHQLPYSWILKYGSIWHRYKTWVEDGTDFLSGVWTDFDYVGNFDPATSATTKNYSLTINGNATDIVLQDNLTNLGQTQTIINTGFYPKTIDDFNVFYQGRRVFDTIAQISGTCEISGTTLIVNTITGNDLQTGYIITGNNISVGTKILTQVSGTTGGVGQYEVNIEQTGSSLNFIVINPVTTGYTNSEIQSKIGNNLFINTTSESIINRPNGFDPNDDNRSLIVKPWTCYILTSDGESVYPLPSFGSKINQTKNECFNTDLTLKTEVIDNSAMYNGSVRLFWKAPQFGYFDNSRLSIPSPDTYLKEVFNDISIQQNFSINGDVTTYSKIDEMFTTFDKEILDMFEQHFLNFSKSSYDYQNILPPTNGEELESDTINKNFQLLMRSTMKVSKPTSDVGNGSQIVDEIQTKQIDNFKTYLSSFMDYNVVIKYGNPSNFDRKLFYTFSTQFIEDEYTYQGYVQSSPNALPSNGGTTTLVQSETQYPQTWKTLKTYVGFSEIPELQYKDNGSYITDFFIDLDVEFNETNIINFAPIIKIYATQKLKNNNLDLTEFYALMNTYINDNTTYINTLLDLEMTRLRAKLPDVNIELTSNKVKSDLEGEQTRYELWELFKSINDTWISGTDFKSKTIFEDVLILDRASRDVGQKIYVDVFKLKDLIENASYKNSLLDIVQTILVENNFVNFTLPAYANFYNVQDVSKTPTPKPEGTLEFANSLFGTFLNVDYRDTTSKFLCVYSSKPSEHLALNDNVDYRYRDDAFDLRRATDNPLLEDQFNKTNWDKSNKVVGFNIDIGPQNQQIFKQFDIGQDPGLPTSESLEILNQMANLNRNRGSYSQSVSLYNLYKNRSYKCSVDMLGNALIQPLMYFNLRNVPMFSGPYMILKVQHKISENGFDTTFEGQRQPFYSIPKIETYIQSLSTKILETIREKIQENEKSIISSLNNVLHQTSEVINKQNNPTTTKDSLTCESLLNESFKNYVKYSPQKSVVSRKDLLNIIRNKVNGTEYTSTEKIRLCQLIYSFMYYTSLDNNQFSAYGNNYTDIPLTTSYGGSNKYFTELYFCSEIGTLQQPLVIFANPDDFVDFMVAKYGTQIKIIQNYMDSFPSDPADIQLVKGISKFFVLNFPSQKDPAVYSKLTEQQLKTLEDRIQDGVNDFNILNES